MAFRLIGEQEADARIEAAYKRIKDRYGGFLPDIYRAFANDPG